MLRKCSQHPRVRTRPWLVSPKGQGLSHPLLHPLPSHLSSDWQVGSLNVKALCLQEDLVKQNLPSQVLQDRLTLPSRGLGLRSHLAWLCPLLCSASPTPLPVCPGSTPSSVSHTGILLFGCASQELPREEHPGPRPCPGALLQHSSCRLCSITPMGGSGFLPSPTPACFPGPRLFPWAIL